MLISLPTHKSKLLISYFRQFQIDIFEAKMMSYGKKGLRNFTPVDGKDLSTRTIKNFKVLDKGCLTYFEEQKEPMRTMRMMEDFQPMFIWKKSIVFLFQFITGKNDFKKKNIFQKFLIVLSIFVNYEFYVRFVHHALLDHFYDHPDRNSQPVREIYRVMPDFPLERDISCFFIEGDWAYRLRVQDVLPELNKGAFNKNPLKETLRLFDILINREGQIETTGGMIDKWRMAKRFVFLGYWYLKIFKKDLLKKIIRAVNELNLEEIKMDKSDRYWADQTGSYQRGGLKHDFRKLFL